MYPIILERDTDIVDWGSRTAGTITSDDDPTAANYLVRSDGVLYPDFGVLLVAKLSAVVAADKCRSVGIHIQGPQPGLEYTPYAVDVNAHCVDEKLRPCFFVGESPATITSAAGGNTVTETRLLRFPETGAALVGSSLKASFTLIIAENTADRGVCFGICMMAGLLPCSDEPHYVHMSVRRLIGVNPLLIDTRKM